MAEIKWIKLDADIFSNRKILQIESLPDGDAIIVIWLKLLTLAGNINDSGMVYFTQEIPYTDQMLASQFRRPLATVQMALKVFEQFGMIEVVDDILHISNWEKYQNVEQMEVIREQNRIRQKKWYDNHKAVSEKPNVRSNVSITLPNATDKIRIEEDKIREDKIRKEKNNKSELKLGDGVLDLDKKVFFDDLSLNKKFIEFILYRKQVIKKPFKSEKGINAAVSKLKELSAIPYSDDIDTSLAINLIEYAMKNEWQSFYPIKEDKKKDQGFMDEWAMWRERARLMDEEEGNI